MAERIDRPLAFVGGGSMANAITRGGLDGGVLEPSLLCVADPDPAKLAPFEREGAHVAPSASEALAWLERTERSAGDGQLVLAVKPQIFPMVADEIAGRCGARVVISILAGTRSQTIRERLGELVRVIRVMPNTPARIGRGTSAVALGAGAETGDDEVAQRLFGAVGPVVERIDETLMDAFTALAGSGPAYVFYLAEAMAKAATEMGFSQKQADRIVRGTISGAGELLAQSDESPEDLRKAVTSKGGTTFAATESLDGSGVMEAIERAIIAARDRGRELGG